MSQVQQRAERQICEHLNKETIYGAEKDEVVDFFDDHCQARDVEALADAVEDQVGECKKHNK